MKAIFWQSPNAVPIKFCQEIIEYAKTRDKSLGVTGSDTKTDDEIKKSLKKRKSNVVSAYYHVSKKIIKEIGKSYQT